MTLGQTIRMIRKERKIKQRELARIVGISVTALANIEKDLSMPARRTFQKICNGLGISEGYLLFSTLTEEDVPPKKREVFRALIPIIKKVFENERD